MHKLGIEHSFIPIPRKINKLIILTIAYTYSNMLMNLCKIQTKYELIDGVFQEVDYINMNTTIDHRYIDGAVAAKIIREVTFF